MITHELKIGSIGLGVEGERLRPLSEAGVAALMDSIKRIGLQQPIVVWRPENSVPKLVAGRNRLEACKRLKWKTIPCVESSFKTWEEARLAEIAENLHRTDLSELERAYHIAEWIKLVEVSNPAGFKTSKRGGRPTGGIRKAARTLSIPQTTAQQAIKIADLSDEAKTEAVATGMDKKKTVLRTAAKEKTPEAQVAVIRSAATKRKTSSDTKPQGASDVADWLYDHASADELPTFISLMDETNWRAVKAELRKRA